jgi:hypothetical protein
MKDCRTKVGLEEPEEEGYKDHEKGRSSGSANMSVGYLNQSREQRVMG